MREPVYLIFDLGKTNKKVLVFSEKGEVADEFSETFAETADEDGFPCDDIHKVREWVLGQYKRLKEHPGYRIKGVNTATYGASFVHLNKAGEPIAPLYNYLKPLPNDLTDEFLKTHFHNSAKTFSLQTASPFLGMLNSGLQLYWLKKHRPDIWNQIHCSLHLPQYISFLFTGEQYSDYTSIGCHTGLWDFARQNYHPWVLDEGLHTVLAPLKTTSIVEKDGVAIGTGLHDSSAALIPYLQQITEPFLLVSTGTWCINLNPFNDSPLTAEELQLDCLSYLQADGKPVKASRIFLGKEHEHQCHRIASHFSVSPQFYKEIKTAAEVPSGKFVPAYLQRRNGDSAGQLNLSLYDSAEKAYAAMMMALTTELKRSIDLVLTPDVHWLFVDGGFANNHLFLHFLRQQYPQLKVKTVDVPQATALGAFLYSQQSIQKMHLVP